MVYAWHDQRETYTPSQGRRANECFTKGVHLQYNYCGKTDTCLTQRPFNVVLPKNAAYIKKAPVI